MAEDSRFLLGLRGSLDSSRIAQNHAKELLALSAVVNSASTRRNIAQNIPRHMRRRQASHNAKRLPQRIRDKIKKGTIPKKNKPPSREYRRRRKYKQGNAREKTGWLETHIWHAKRFHMIERYGFKLASLPTLKGMTAVLRAAQKGCLIYDESYVKCLEISGVQLREIFPQLFPCDYDLLFTEEVYSGYKETTSLLYNPGETYPQGIIAPVTVMCSSSQSAWLWCHTCAFLEVVELFSGIKDSRGLTYTDLTGELVRFFLRGPESCQILNKTMYLLDETSSGSSDATLKIVSSNIDWAGISCPKVRDPRLCLVAIQERRRREKDAETDPDKNSTRLQVESSSQKYPFHQSSLWKKRSREETINSRKPTQVLQQKKTPIPGSNPPVQKDETGIAVIISECLNRHEFSFIAPKGWGKDFWLAFQYAGARPAGLTEVNWTTTDRCRLRFPDDYPDTVSGREDERVSALQAMEDYSRRPPQNRCNYDRLILNSPFRYEWSAIVNKEKFNVLRSRPLLQELSASLNGRFLDVAQFTDFDLVITRINMLNRGVPESRAHVCIPTKDDIFTLRTQHENIPLHGVTEPQPKGKQALERDEYHTVKLEAQSKPSRELIGYVKSGFYSRTDGRAKGHAIIDMKYFISLVKDKDYIKLNSRGEQGLLVLLRSIDSLQYRYALLQVETNM